MITVFRGVTSVSAMPGKVAGSEANVCHLDFSGQDVGDMEGVCCSRVGGDGGRNRGGMGMLFVDPSRLAGDA